MYSYLIMTSSLLLLLQLGLLIHPPIASSSITQEPLSSTAELILCETTEKMKLAHAENWTRFSANPHCPHMHSKKG